MSAEQAHPIPASIAPAAQRVKEAARAACERTVESLSLAAMSSSNVHQRDGLMAAQFELHRKSAVFALTFNEALDDRLRRDFRPRSGATVSTSWGALSLVDDREHEVQIAAERFGLEVGHSCEWELRELEGFMGPLFASAGHARTDQDRNPLRPESVGYAVIRAIESVTDRADVRKVLEAEFARTLSATMPATYAAVAADLSASGLKAAGMGYRASEGSGHDNGRIGGLTGPGALGQGGPASGRGGDPGPTTGGRGSGLGAFGDSQRSGMGQRGGGRGAPMGRVDAELMALMRRLTAFSGGDGGGGGGGSPRRPGDLAPYDSGTAAFEEYTEDGLRLAAPNLIRAHRDELRQVSHGALDHMVIDVIGSLFDQILSDPKVPPQMARQIGRLQLPVLRTALGDASFFSSRKHPVRRFINRIASLASAFEDIDDEDGREFLKLVRELVQEIVDGDFDQIEVYEQKLLVLESFVAEQARREAKEKGDAPALLAEKEGDLRVQRRYAQLLDAALRPLPAPEFVRDFLSQMWSQVLLKAARVDAADGARVKRMRHAARELFMSVQPKGEPTQRKAFLLQLPRLMQELNEGMDLIGWPDTAKKTFFGLLLPAHAQSLRGEGLSTLDFNLLARQVDAAFETPVPQVADLLPGIDLPVLTEEAVLPRFSAEEAQRIGLVDEAAFDWDGTVDIDIGAETPITEVDIAIEGLPAPEPVEAMQGESLAENVQIGFAYQMHLEGEWQKVRLNHVSPGRTFFVFTRGKRHKQAISLTHRMLVRLCESKRLRAFESAYLLERATARARRQLSALSPALA
ncbi:MAG TPA: DUF1631 family protein [Rubrivivax sp.]